MIKPIHNTHRGLSTQHKVTLLLFLQLHSDSNFSHVVFEDDDWEDATFHFNDGKRIFLEVKDLTSKKITLTYVKNEIFPSFINKSKLLGDEDKILIAGRSFAAEVGSYATSLEYMSDWSRPKLEEKGFTSAEIKLLSKTVTFEFNEYLDENLIAYLAPILGFWLPDQELVSFKDHLLQQIVVNKSSSGLELNRGEFRSIIEQQRKSLQVGIYDPEKNTNKQRVNEILSTLKDESQRQRTIENPRVLSSLMSNPSDVSFLFTILEKEVESDNVFDLNKWRPLFEASVHPAYTFRLQMLFKTMLEKSTAYDDYFLEFWVSNIEKLIPPFQDGYIVGELLRSTIDLLERRKDLVGSAFELLQKSYGVLKRGKYEDGHLSTSDNHDRQELGQLALAVHGIIPEDRKIEVLDWVHQHYTLNRDHGDFLSSTPQSIYKLWLEHIKDFKNPRLLAEFLARVEEDYLEDPQLMATKGKKKGTSIYQGYEAFGNGIAQSGDHYSITDSAIVELILKPYFEKWYELDSESLWNFLPELISTKQTDIGLLQDGKIPDYIGRSLIPIICKYYFGNSKERVSKSYSWLTGFMKFRKSIPSRTDLIFQELYVGHSSDDKTWRLIKYQFNLDGYNKAPANIFVEKILEKLVISGKDEPVEYIRSLIDNESYIRYRLRHDFYLANLVNSLIDLESARQSGIMLLKKLLDSDFYSNKLDHFEAYDIKGPLNSLIRNDLDAACLLFKDLMRDETKLSRNTQIALTVCLKDLPLEKEIIEKIYIEVFRDAFIRSKSGELKLSDIFTFEHSRENFTDLATNLFKTKQFEYGYEILDELMDDPSPKIDEYIDSMKKPNDTHAIQSVKAHVAWSLTNVVSVDGRDYLRRGFELVKRLAQDESVYIRSQACFPLTSFVRARHFRTSDDDDRRFMEDASLVNDIDELALSLLEDTNNHGYPSLTKSIVHVFSYIRALDTQDAKRIVDAVLKTNEYGIEDYIPTLFFFAEFREESFEEWPWQDEFPLGKFDPVYFQDVIKTLSQNAAPRVKSVIAWNLWVGFKKEKVEKPKIFEMIDRYFNSLTKKYDSESFTNLYHLADDLVKENEVERGISIWKKCILAELAATESKVPVRGYRGRYYDGEMLLTIKTAESDDEFQKWLEIVLNKNFDTYLSNVKELYAMASEHNREIMQEIYPHLFIDEIQ